MRNIEHFGLENLYIIKVLMLVDAKLLSINVWFTVCC